MLVLGIDDAGGVVTVLELDEVLAQMVRGAGELVAQRAVLPGLELRAADLVLAHPDVGREQVDMGVHVAHVERQRVLGGQLPDLLDRFEAVDALFERGHGHSAVTSTADRPPSTGSAAPVM